MGYLNELTFLLCVRASRHLFIERPFKLKKIFVTNYTSFLGNEQINFWNGMFLILF